MEKNILIALPEFLCIYVIFKIKLIFSPLVEYLFLLWLTRLEVFDILY